jgi:hypothetical protein
MLMNASGYNLAPYKATSIGSTEEEVAAIGPISAIKLETLPIGQAKFMPSLGFLSCTYF